MNIRKIPVIAFCVSSQVKILQFRWCLPKNFLKIIS